MLPNIACGRRVTLACALVASLSAGCGDEPTGGNAGGRSSSGGNPSWTTGGTSSAGGATSAGGAQAGGNSNGGVATTQGGAHAGSESVAGDSGFGGELSAGGGASPFGGASGTSGTTDAGSSGVASGGMPGGSGGTLAVAGGSSGGTSGGGTSGSGAGGQPNCEPPSGGPGGLASGRCFVERDCANGNCVGARMAKVCVPLADACTSDADCDGTERCDGFCRKGIAFGEPCTRDDRCADSGVSCDQHFHRCLRTFTPATCASDADCPSGTHCQLYGHLQPSFACMGQAGLGTWCDSNPCAADLCCAGPAGSRSCVAKSTCGVTGGPPDCMTFACPAGLHCDYETATTCLTNLPLGAPCAVRAGHEQVGAEPCAPGLYCGGNSTEGFSCRPSPEEGEPCAMPAGAPSPLGPLCIDSYQHGCSPCRVGLYCADNGRCARLAQIGEPCDASPCADGLRCAKAFVDGECQAAGGSGGNGAGGATGGGGTPADCTGALHFGGLALEQAVRSATGVWNRDLLTADVAGLSFLSVFDMDEGGLSGIECLPNLAILDLTGRGFRDLNGLRFATQLRALRLHSTEVEDVSVLAGLSQFSTLLAEGTPLQHLSALAANPAVSSVTIYGPLDCASAHDDIEALVARGAFVNVSCPLRCGLSWTGDLKAVSLATGYSGACAIVSDGRVRCWDAKFVNSVSTPTGPAFVPGVVNAVQVSVGSGACALTGDGAVSCWGSEATSPSSGLGAPSGATAIGGLPPVDQVVVAELTPICVLLRDQTVRCWGLNNFGGLGNNDPTVSSVPANSATPVVGLSNVIALSAGEVHVCALRADGTVWCWGDNSARQLGGTTQRVSYVPVKVPGVDDAIAVSAGTSHTCALRRDHSVWCWGNAWAGSGNATPTRVEGLCDVVAVSAGSTKTCALTGEGSVYCWGLDHDLGALGDGLHRDSERPVLVAGVSSGVALSADEFGGCVITNGGGVRCWGPVGYGGQVPDCVPGFRPSVANGGATSCEIGVASYSPGELASGNACLACEPDFSVSGWSALPDGTSCESQKVCLHGECRGGCRIDANVYEANAGNPHNPCESCQPQLSTVNWSNVPSIDCVTSVSGGGQTVAVRGGGAYAWGLDVRSPKAVPGLSAGVTQVDAGAQHGCAIANGTAYCWGSNVSGQLGDGSFTDATQATLALNPSSWVSAGTSHSCGIQNGEVYCWGDNTVAQLGIGTLISSSSPVHVSGVPSGATQVSAGAVHSCAVSGGSLYCWGSNNSGQLGNATRTSALVPIQVPGLSGQVTRVAADGDQTCAIVNAKVWCWGSNARGQLGNGWQVDSNVPVTVQNLQGDATEVAVSGVGACAIVSGRVYCWGASQTLGNGSQADSLLPVPASVLVGSTASAIGVGLASCAVLDGRVECWGDNLRGDVGIPDGGTAIPLPRFVNFP